VRIVDTVQDDLQIGPIPKPYQKPHPPIAISAMSPNSGLAKLAGERGWSVISANFNAISNTRTHWRRYAEGCAEAGRPPEISAWRVARSILVTETDAQARDYLARPDNSLLGYFHYLRTQLTRAGMLHIFKPEPTTPDDVVTDQFCLDTMAIAGSPRTVADRLVALMDDIGPFGTLLAAFHEWDDDALWRRSMQLLAEEVMPRVSAAARTRKAAS
jgi:alkanesulfonate monooxygenase SsuD/methylene tetrahydromethanopterin reductase-like flavin-dependent oxidoreductase (luciferase family)